LHSHINVMRAYVVKSCLSHIEALGFSVLSSTLAGLSKRSFVNHIAI